MAKTITTERLAFFEELLDEGWSFWQIQKTYGTTWATLNRHFPGRGMDQREAAKLGAASRRLTLKLKHPRMIM